MDAAHASPHRGEPALPLWRPEHEALRDSARTFVRTEIVPQVEQWERDGDYPRSLFRTAGDAGFLGLRFDPAWGGSGPDLLAQAVWVEELARCGSGGVAADLGASVDLAAVYVDRSGTDEQKARWLAPAVAGRAIGALAITEPGTGSDVAGITTRARRDADGWLLRGEKVFITNGSWCDYAVVAAKVAPEDGGGDDPHAQITLFVVDADCAGFERRRMQMLGWRTSHTGELHFDDVRVSDGHRLGEVGSGFLQIVGNFAWERLVLSLGAVVAAEEVLAAATAYGRQREAFGRPVGSFQVWRHRFADLATQVATARSLTEHALRLTVAQDLARREGTQGPDDAEVLRAVAMAKLVTQRLAVQVADDNLQIHGGAGYMMDVPAQRYLRDARLGPIGGGTDAIMREVIGRTLGL